MPRNASASNRAANGGTKRTHRNDPSHLHQPTLYQQKHQQSSYLANPVGGDEMKDDETKNNMKVKSHKSTDITTATTDPLMMYSHNTTNYELIEKAVEINLVLNESKIDLWRLRELALTEGGLVNDTIRRRAWPKLVGLYTELWDDDSKLDDSEHQSTIHQLDSSSSHSLFSKSTTTAKSHSNTNGDGIYPSPTKRNNNSNDDASKGSTTAKIINSSSSSSSSSVSSSNHITSKRSESIKKKKKRQKFGTPNNNTVIYPEYPKNDATPLTSPSPQREFAKGNRSNESDNASISSYMSSRDIIIAKCIDFMQIELDCKRCTWHLLTGSQRAQRIQMENKRDRKIAKLIRRKQRRLSNLINYTLTKSYMSNSLNSSSNHKRSASNLRLHMKNSATISQTSDLSSSNPSKTNGNGSSLHHEENSYKTGSVSLVSIAESDNEQQQKPNHSNYYRYYQGYHDVACVVLSTLSGCDPTRFSLNSNLKLFSSFDENTDNLARACNIDLPSAVLYQLSQSHFADCLKPNFWDLQTIMRLAINPLLSHYDSVLYKHFVACEMELPYYALSWIITWFSHEIRDTELVKRLFDCFIVSHPLFPIYVSVAMILHPTNRAELLKTDCDFSALHQALSTLTRNSSMVGWKYRPGDGYVSDDGGDEDGDDDIKVNNRLDDSVSIDADSFVLVSETWAASQEHAESVSVVSSSLSSNVESRVPFQDIIDQALQYMEQVPPRSLMRLAVHHYSSEQLQEILEPLAEQHKMIPPTASMIAKNPEGTIATYTAQIQMFRSPSWARTPTCPSNRVLRELISETKKDKYPRVSSNSSIDRLRQRKRIIEESKNLRLGNGTHDKSKLSNDEDKSDDHSDDEGLNKYLEEKSKLAKIAAGYSNDDYLDRRHNRYKRTNTMSIGVAVAVVAVAIAVGIYVQHQKQQEDQKKFLINPDPTPKILATYDIERDNYNDQSSNRRQETRLPRTIAREPLDKASNPTVSTVADILSDSLVVSQNPPKRTTSQDHITTSDDVQILAVSALDRNNAAGVIDSCIIDDKNSQGVSTLGVLSQCETGNDRGEVLAEYRTTQQRVDFDTSFALTNTRVEHPIKYIIQSAHRAMEDFKGIGIFRDFQKQWKENFLKHVDKHKPITGNDDVTPNLPAKSTQNGPINNKDIHSLSLMDQLQILSGDLVDSPVSLGVRDFIKDLTKSPFVRALANINNKQVSIHVQKTLIDLLENALVQNSDVIRRGGVVSNEKQSVAKTEGHS